MSPSGDDTIVVTQPPSAKSAHVGIQRKQQQLQVKISPIDYPRSQSSNWIPPLPVTPEYAAIAALKTEWKQQADAAPAYDGYDADRPILIAEANDFEIYRSPDAGTPSRRHELISLHLLEIPNPKKLCFDGIISVGNKRRYVQGLVIRDCSVEGYGDSESPLVVTYVQTEGGHKDTEYDVWIRLNRPSRKYRRFHGPFLWIAQLAKHAIDFMEGQVTNSISLNSFRKAFHSWLTTRYHDDADFQRWHNAYNGRSDFRASVNMHIEFLYRQALNLPNARQLQAQPLWSDCMVRGLATVKPWEQVVQHTLATPATYYCFKDMYFGRIMRSMQPSALVHTEQTQRMAKLRFSKTQVSETLIELPWIAPAISLYKGSPVQVGDVIAFDPDEGDIKFWGAAASRQWFGYVQRTVPHGGDGQRLYILYLYHPRETNISEARYPYKNELFFSDNCNCDEGQLLAADIKGKYKVDWNPSIIPTKNYFIRQTYVTQDSAFVTFKCAHKECICATNHKANVKDFRPGDTVYISRTKDGRKILEAVVVRQIDKATDKATVRRLSRLRRDCSHLLPSSRRIQDIAANELVLTDDYESVALSRLERRCHVRFVPKHDLLHGRVPFAYDRGGAGDLWMISMGLAVSNEGQRLVYLQRLPEKFLEGVDLAIPLPGARLRGLSIFSGGGGLDRGLIEGGAVDFETTVDFSPEAIHTQRANAPESSKMQYFCGSVDDYLKAALNGKQHRAIARVGAVDFIAAGSPCPGFSTLQPDVLSEASIRNASHISTFCSFLDLYRPEYAVLENVVSMAAVRIPGQNVLSQLVACLVSMGYQVNQFIMDTWSYGSAQHRSRLFLTVAAPGLDPITQPWHTHSRSSEHIKGRSLGTLPNGQRFGEREYYPTPFPQATAEGLFADLPDIGNGNVLSCISHPDHRTVIQAGHIDRAILQCMPMVPPGCEYRDAYKLGLIPSSLHKPGRENCRGYARVQANGLVPCITTCQSLQANYNGAIVHWSQDRPITLLEARRAQGWIDDEPIIGSVTERYRIVGNGVDRRVSFSLGLALREVTERNKRRKSNCLLTRSANEIMEEEEDDAVSVSSNIRVNVPADLESMSATGSSTALTIDSSGSGSTTTETSVDIPQYDGAAGTMDETPGVINGRQELVHRAKSTPLAMVATTTTSLGKRSHSLDCEQSSLQGKRLKVERAKGSSTTGISRSGIGDALCSLKMRSTRHSGLQIAFQPKQWNKRPEHEHSSRQ